MDFPKVKITGGPAPKDVHITIDDEEVTGRIKGVRFIGRVNYLNRVETDYIPPSKESEVDTIAEIVARKHGQVIETGVEYTLNRALAAHRIVVWERDQLHCQCGEKWVNYYDSWLEWSKHVAHVAGQLPKEQFPPRVYAQAPNEEAL